MATPEIEELFRELSGDVIYTYTRKQAIEDGVLVDLTEWASADKGFMGATPCPWP
jgi:type I site-specific restriction endonuclease